MRKAAALMFLFMLSSAAPVGAAEAPLRVAVGAMLSPKETFLVYRYLVEYIGHKLGRRAEIVQRKDYSQVDELLRNSEVDLAFICSGPYVLDHREFGVELIAAPVVRGKATYKSFIIVNKASPYRSLKDLRRKKFAYTDPASNTGCWAPKYMLAKQGEDPATFFSKTVFSHGHDSSVRAVADGVVDGAGVDSLIYEYMMDKGYPAISRVKVVDESEPFAVPPVVAPRGLDPKLKAAVKKALLEMHEDPGGRKILSELFIDKFVELPDSAYESVRGMCNYTIKRERGNKK